MADVAAADASMMRSGVPGICPAVAVAVAVAA